MSKIELDWKKLVVEVVFVLATWLVAEVSKKK